MRGIRSWIKFVERWHNWASDTRFVWFPFETLRPTKSQPITFWRTLVMSIAFGTYYGVFLAIRKLILGESFEMDTTAKTILGAAGVFLVWFNGVTAPLWNSRARRLTPEPSIQKFTFGAK